MNKLISIKNLSKNLHKSIISPNSLLHNHNHNQSFKHFHTISRSPPISPQPTTTNYGFFSNPVFSKYFSSSSISQNFKGSVNSLVGPRIFYLRSQFPKSNSPSHWSSTYKRSWSSWTQRYSADNVVIGLIVANAAVYVLWQVFDRDFMRKNFTISVDNITSGRLHTLITSAFSHVDMGHIASNMIGLYFFGSNIGRHFGPEFLLQLYLAGAVVGSLFYVVYHAFQKQGTFGRDPSKVPGLGASGAVNAIMLLDIFLFPKATLLFDFFIPVPAILLGVYLIGQDVLRILKGDDKVSGSAHLGGAAVAAAAWLRLKKGRGLRF